MAYPVSLSEVKNHIDIDSDDFDNDKYIEELVIPAATQYCFNIIDNPEEEENPSPPVKLAILIAAADFYDVERNSYTLSNIKRGDVIMRLLLPYKITRG